MCELTAEKEKKNLSRPILLKIVNTHPSSFASIKCQIDTVRDTIIPYAIHDCLGLEGSVRQQTSPVRECQTKKKNKVT